MIDSVFSFIFLVAFLSLTLCRAETAEVKRLSLSKLPKLKNDLIIKAALNKPTSRVPVWMMRQAGRHLPEFRELSNRGEGYDFFSMCRNPNIAVEVSLQPLDRYGVDAVIIFSDILVIPQAMGMKIDMVKGVGPVFQCPLRHPEDIKNIDLTPDVESTLGYVLDAVNLARQKIDGRVPLIGFVGGPLSLLMFMIEGRSSKLLMKLKRWLFVYPDTCHELLSALSDICVEFLVAQQRAGAQVLQVFESVAVESLTQDQYYEFVYPYLSSIAERVKRQCGDTPLLLFSKGTDYAVEKLAETKFDCLGLCYTSDVEQVRKRIEGRGKALMGNLDPSCLLADKDVIRKETNRMLNRFGPKGYIANLGHGCLPEMSPDNVETFVKCVQEKCFSAK
ncbi:hypothetical protein CTEN210_04372 [Chaetoceros tenuissimus]|uniref:Uroporphyrinogen decarboxylase n=1 Tax=Chaetoceros tenuissimus TaxID=426638 RepID=A0AAD3H2H8_9STRA|nr:hypothetical protein CTEN210_04372 [Chaetoceros tenuissimus]